MGSIVEATKEGLKSTGYSIVCDYQHKTVETYLSRREMFVPLPVQLSSWHASCFTNIVAPFLASMDPLHYSKLSRT